MGKAEITIAIYVSLSISHFLVQYERNLTIQGFIPTVSLAFPSNQSYRSPRNMEEGTLRFYFLLSFLWLISSSPAAIAGTRLPSRRANRSSTRPGTSLPRSDARTVARHASRSASPHARCIRQCARSAVRNVRSPSSLDQSRRAASPFSARIASWHSDLQRESDGFLTSLLKIPRSAGDFFEGGYSVVVNSYFVYMLRCADGSCYVGVTNDLEKRIGEHQTGWDPKAYTHRRRPVELVYAAEFPEITDAIDFEKQVKGWARKKKEALIKRDQKALEHFSRRRGGKPRKYHCSRVMVRGSLLPSVSSRVSLRCFLLSKKPRRRKREHLTMTRGNVSRSDTRSCPEKERRNSRLEKEERSSLTNFQNQGPRFRSP